MTKPTSKPTRYAVYFPEPQAQDHVLLAKVLEQLSAGRRSSDFLRALALRGWLHILHELPAQERSLQLRALELSDDTLREVNAKIPAQSPLTINRAVSSAGQDTTLLADLHAGEPLVAKAPSTIAVPDNSRMGKVGAGAGLS